MKQCIAVIVAACLLISSCSAEKTKPVLTPMIEPITITSTVQNIHIEPVKIPPIINTVSPVDANCMAKAIYYESRGESMAGKIAVGYVILNRTTDSRYPNTICGVVTQVTYIKHKKFCQFSWYCQGGRSKLDANISNPAYAICYATSVAVLTGMVDSNVGNAVSFHIRHLNAGWAKHGMKLVTTIGNHMFYERINYNG